MGIGFAEVVMILVIIVLIFGASRLPALGRGVGAGIRNGSCLAERVLT